MLKINPTPKIAAVPELSALLNREGPDRRARVMDGEFGSLSIFSEGRLAWSSGERDLSLSPVFDPPVIHHRDGKRLNVLFTYTRIKRGKAFSTVVKVRDTKLVTLPGGKIKVSFPQNPRVRTISPTRGDKPKPKGSKTSVRSPSPVRIARQRVAGVMKPKPARPTLAPRANTLRPNESQNIPSVEFYELESGKPNHTYSVDQVVASKFRYSRSWTGVRTPRFKALKPSQYPVNPHTVTILDVEADGPLMEISDQRHVDNGYSSGIFAFTKKYAAPAGPSHLPLARNNTIRSLINKAQLGAQAGLGEDIAQVRQTLSMISGGATKIYKSMKALKQGNLVGAANFLFAGQPHRFPNGKGPSLTKSLANNWLQLQYGWKPLLNDIKGTLQALPTLMGGNQGFVQQVTSTGSAFSNETSLTNPSSPNCTSKMICEIQTSTHCKMVLRYRIASPLSTFLSQVGLANPISLGWELLPFSFVVDWFVGVGPFLDALTAWNGLEFLDGSQTLFTRQVVASSIDGGNVSPLNNTLIYVTHGSYHRTGILLSRTKLTAFPTQTFPKFGTGLSSVYHAANAIALVKSVFGR